MKIKVSQASDHIIIQLENGRDIEISYYAAEGKGAPSSCRIICDGREIAANERRAGKMDLWEIFIPGKHTINFKGENNG